MKPMLLAGLLFVHPAHADQQLQVLEVRLAGTPAWGTNSAAITVKNADARPRDVAINWQATNLTLGRGWGLDSTETIGAGETRSFTAEYVDSGVSEIYNEKERIDPYHEVTHIIAGSIGDPPALFNEGLAAWSQEGHRWDGVAADSWAKGFGARGMLWPMEKIFAFHEFGSEGSRASIAYPQGASIVNFLIGRYGFDKFLTAYRTLKNSADPPANAVKFTEIFGESVEAVGKAWLASLADATIPVAPDKLLDEVQAKYK